MGEIMQAAKYVCCKGRIDIKIIFQGFHTVLSISSSVICLGPALLTIRKEFRLNFLNFGLMLTQWIFVAMSIGLGLFAYQ
jgi:hypothetical protein